MMTAAEILRLARAYATATDTTLHTVGRLALRNNRLFVRLAEGHGCNARSIERAEEWFAAHWPQGVRWPEGLPVPPPKETAGQDSREAA